MLMDALAAPHTTQNQSAAAPIPRAWPGAEEWAPAQKQCKEETAQSGLWSELRMRELQSKAFKGPCRKGSASAQKMNEKDHSSDTSA